MSGTQACTPAPSLAGAHHMTHVPVHQCLFDVVLLGTMAVWQALREAGERVSRAALHCVGREQLWPAAAQRQSGLCCVWMWMWMGGSVQRPSRCYLAVRAPRCAMRPRSVDAPASSGEGEVCAAQDRQLVRVLIRSLYVRVLSLLEALKMLAEEFEARRLQRL